MLTIVRRRVAPRARAWRPSASVAATRSRLWATAAHRIRAELAPKRPHVRQRPVDQVGKTVSMMAWRRWVMSASATGSVGEP
jgi:hypothetical protein